MARTYDQACPIAKSLDLLGERWTLLIVRELLKGPRRFAELASLLPGIPPATLSARLKRLEQAGVLDRRVMDERPPRAEYSVTAAGEALWVPLRALGIWGTQHLDTPYDRVHQTCLGQVSFELHCTSCGGEVADSDCTLHRKPTTRD